MNIIRPGYIETDLSVDFLTAMEGSIEGGLKIMAEKPPVGHVGKPEDVAGLIAYLRAYEPFCGFVLQGPFLPCLSLNSLGDEENCLWQMLL